MENSNSETCYLCPNPVVQICIRCGKGFCDKDTNKLDPRYCNECNTDIVIETTTFTRRDEDYNEETKTITSHTSRCKQITFKGIDWMFICHKLSEMTDDEQKTALEYHRAMVYQLQTEIMSSIIKKQREIQLNFNEKAFDIKRKSKTISTKVITPNKKLNVEKIAEALQKLGITDEMLKAAMQRK